MDLKILGGKSSNGFLSTSLLLTSFLLFASIPRSHGGEEALPRPLPLSGWSTPSPAGWTAPVLSSSIIGMSSSLSAGGEGSAGASHAESVAAVGAREARELEQAREFFYLARDP